MDRKELLLSPLAYMLPPRLLAGLEPGESARVIPGATHSIVEILAHLVFWQSWFIGRCAGDARPMVARASEGWPPAGAEDWLTLRAQFLADLQRAAEWPGDGPVAPAIEAPRHGALHHLRGVDTPRGSQRASPRAGRDAAAGTWRLAAAGRKLDLVATAQSRRSRQLPL